VQQRRLVEQALRIVEMGVPRSSGRYALVEEVYGDGVRRRRRLVELRGDAGEEEIVEKRRRSPVAEECGGEEVIVASEIVRRDGGSRLVEFERGRTIDRSWEEGGRRIRYRDGHIRVHIRASYGLGYGFGGLLSQN
jgi:hypothetical protein